MGNIFDWMQGAFENALDVGVDLVTFEWENITKKKVAKLLSDGLTVAAAAATLGLAEDVVKKLMEK